MPAGILLIAYRYLGPWVTGAPEAWNFRYVGSHYLPEVALLLIIAVVPDALQAAYMTATVTIDQPEPDSQKRRLRGAQ